MKRVCQALTERKDTKKEVKNQINMRFSSVFLVITTIFTNFAA